MFLGTYTPKLDDKGRFFLPAKFRDQFGSGLVIIIDGHHIRHTNIADLKEGSPISIENIIVHVLAKGNCFDLKERKFYVEGVTQNK